MSSAKLCTLGVGCEQYGVCYAEAQGQPDRCGRPMPQLEWRPHKIGFVCDDPAYYSLLKQRGELYEVRHNGMLVGLNALPLEEAKACAQRHYEKRGLTYATR